MVGHAVVLSTECARALPTSVAELTVSNSVGYHCSYAFFKSSLELLVEIMKGSFGCHQRWFQSGVSCF